MGTRRCGLAACPIRPRAPGKSRLCLRDLVREESLYSIKGGGFAAAGRPLVPAARWASTVEGLPYRLRALNDAIDARADPKALA
ncbi:MAG TPA: hypothetical protein VNF71_03025 [Acidimicrobiales bacterium]|nr:hypothetical protein [Acidimicrobiales bacterium]